MEDLIGGKGKDNLSKIEFMKQMVSMGHQTSGALELWNYPMWVRDLISQDEDASDRPDHVDLAALERTEKEMLQIPISKREDLTDDKEAIKTLREVYGDDVEMAAEKKIKDFDISETAFFIFLLMASSIEKALALPSGNLGGRLAEPMVDVGWVVDDYDHSKAFFH
ncbi:hypothetical protein RND71_012382 [Anisodus tanguticus]|uniref:Uncharacterized protein n=1 Tax=Anisodus tanguticus TaxID=243964 RepID=A0AAE1VQN7_9SOLA|nr:hypothetical protein RND71_012382 [Anisodus tanguticus]